MSLIMQGLTSNSEEEVKNVISMLLKTTINTNMIHESFYKNDASKYTRDWFAWGNSLFGELILKVYHNMPNVFEQIAVSSEVVIKN